MNPASISRALIATLLGWAGLLQGVHAEDGVDARQLLIGQSITLEGGKNDYGTAVIDGARSYFDLVNRRGGVHGRQIALKVLDDNNQATQAEANAKALIEQHKVFLVFGSIEGGPSTAVMNVTTAQQVPFFGPMAGAPALRTPFQPLVFPVRAEHKEEFDSLLKYAKSLGMRRVGFLRSDSGNGREHLANVQALARSAGMELVADMPFKSDIDANGIASLVTQLKASGAQVVFNHGGIGVYEKFIRQARAQGLSTAFFGVNSGSTQLARHLGNLAHGMTFSQVMPSPWERKTAITRAYQDAFAASKPGQEFSYGSLEGYVTARALVEALQLAGRQPTRRSFVEGLNNAAISIEGLQLTYSDKAHTGLDWVDLAIVTREGRFRH
ncbi:MAG: ABC transporter substrate-binding protein [Hydrogenophaga sp.]|uniref:ABC transporter substrate-binding protein n=1 Tax=Hydrogenophaga sp. TaxID=1904254 RepID=UPI0025C49A6B|nr:ABC transporter substrate-binding protein [Hydrogenophaga sp.]MBT9550174.1 ABC transporter substrate-binding protein [Hydrogenophaga sp.]